MTLKTKKKIIAKVTEMFSSNSVLKIKGKVLQK